MERADHCAGGGVRQTRDPPARTGIRWGRLNGLEFDYQPGLKGRNISRSTLHACAPEEQKCRITSGLIHLIKCIRAEITHCIRVHVSLTKSSVYKLS
jgi:hypothetical protein